LGLSALVTPDESGTENFAVGVEHDAAVHLAGETDGLDLGTGEFSLGHDSGDGFASGSPPVIRVLFGPADVLRVNICMFAAARGSHFAAAVDQNCPGAACSNIYSEQHTEFPLE